MLRHPPVMTVKKLDRPAKFIYSRNLIQNLYKLAVCVSLRNSSAIFLRD